MEYSALQSPRTYKPCKVSLDEPTHVYQPGDTTTGTVELLKTAAAIPSLELQGIAKAEIKCKDSISRNGTVVVLQNIPLQAAPAGATVSEPVYELYSFTAVVPSSSELFPAHVASPSGRIEKTKYWYLSADWPDGRRWYGKTNTSAPLPPTCRFGPRGISLKSECWVEYAIAAYYGQTTGFAKHSTGECLAYYPFWLLSLPPIRFKLPSGEDKPEYVCDQDKRLQFTTERLAAKDVTRPTALQRMKSGLRKAPSPSAAFSVKLMRPRTLRPGTAIHVWIELTPMDTDTVRHALARQDTKIPTVTPIPMPNVVLKEAKLQLVSETHVRTRAAGFSMLGEDDWEEVLPTLIEPPKMPKNDKKDRSVPAQDDDQFRPTLLGWSADGFSAHRPKATSWPS
ncbi:hypothetical protein LTR37_012211 [Vermiconidia calcicola]|uniref:Uncharacterized protein n=1 Tax=Vermiconidia calcicola TaxID=1690605 RepID=A0ACC3N1R9_9PEZI|nr:hypothetical protein LTR37_012211 [Vermiconidia calcicola]